jgi:hypothetical protein
MDWPLGHGPANLEQRVAVFLREYRALGTAPILRWRTEARARRYPKQYWRSSTQRQSLISRIVDRKRIRLQKVPILLS